MKRLIKVVSKIATLLSSFLVLACSGGAGYIIGVVENVAGEPLSDVSVYIIGVDSTTTNSAGEYALENLEPDEYLVYASKDGYTTATTYEETGATKNFTLRITRWIGTWFSGSYACDFTATRASMEPTGPNTHFDGTNFTRPNKPEGILDLGPNALDDIGTVPTTGYSSATLAYVGNCYAICTVEGNYVKLHVNYFPVAIKRTVLTGYISGGDKAREYKTKERIKGG